MSELIDLLAVTGVLVTESFLLILFPFTHIINNELTHKLDKNPYYDDGIQARKFRESLSSPDYIERLMSIEGRPI